MDLCNVYVVWCDALQRSCKVWSNVKLHGTRADEMLGIPGKPQTGASRRTEGRRKGAAGLEAKEAIFSARGGKHNWLGVW